MEEKNNKKHEEEELNTHIEEPRLFEEKSARKGRGWMLIPVLIAALLFFIPRAGIQGEGVLKAHRLHTLGLTSSGILKEVLHKKGDLVREGNLLARFENPELTKNYEERKLSVEILLHEKERLIQKKAFLEKEKQRQTLLHENQVISAKDLEMTELELSETAEELAAKEKEIKKMKQEAAYLKGKVESLELKAPFEGIVLSDPEEKIGNLVREGEFVLELVDPKSFYLETSIRETQIERVAVGDTVSVRFRAIPFESFGGTIAKVGPRTEQEVEKVFKVKHVVPCEIRLTEIPANARYGMRASVRIKPGGEKFQAKAPKEGPPTEPIPPSAENGGGKVGA